MFVEVNGVIKSVTTSRHFLGNLKELSTLTENYTENWFYKKRVGNFIYFCFNDVAYNLLTNKNTEQDSVHVMCAICAIFIYISFTKLLHGRIKVH